ncbi:MAG: substrate-binding domain-containing protein [Candidatus Binatia bacterium]|nr:substrate-binding domain-containing protein [Candidatus Binatia bacterium]
MSFRLRAAAPFALILALGATPGSQGQSHPAPREVFLATTSSVENSGLLAFLLPQFERTSGVRVRVLPVGSGQALELAGRGDADVVLTHAPSLEEEALARGVVAEPRVVMENEFVLVGPPNDPAHITGLDDIAKAMATIAAEGQPFVSRGDRSGTHTAELNLWARAEVRPSGPWYLEAGQGMGAALMMSAERRAYTLTDWATFLAYRNRERLRVLVRNKPPLRNVYRIFLSKRGDAPSARQEAARQLILWLTSPAGQHAIASFRIDGEQVFWPTAQTAPSPPAK